MKVIVDIENKTLKMLENNRAIFKGEYSADKLVLLINKTLVNEYPVITGLLSNGRKIGGYTTDSSYGTETIDGVTYTTAEFTLSKENGFTLSEGIMQITVWIYKTVNSEVVSKTAIGNITFNVVNTTSFNDGDIIISGDVEGTVVNLKVEVENLQQVTQMNNSAINKLNNDLNNYLLLNGEKSMTGDLKMKDNNIIFEENGKIVQSIDNNLNEYTFPKKSGELALNEDIPTKTSQLTNDSGFALKEEIPTKTSQLENDSNYASQDDLNNVIEIAEGKTKTYVISTKNNALEFTFEWEPIYIKATTYEDTFTTISNQKIPYRDLKVGDIILITDSKIPDRYLADIMYNGSEYTYVFYNLETRKMNLDEYALKIEIPTKVSRLDNDSGFITNAVNNLTNYYLKSETYTKSEVQQLLSTISSLKLEVVTNLPTTNISSNTIYLKPLDSAKENNIYEEYIYINNKWETIGTTAVDLTNYALKTEIPTKLSELEQDISIGGGVEEEDVMNIIENNAEQTETLNIGTSETFDSTSDNQIPTSKAVSDFMASAGGGSKLYRHNITIIKASDKCRITLNIENNSNEPFTVSTLALFLCNNGHTNDERCYTASGFRSNSGIGIINGLYNMTGNTYDTTYCMLLARSTAIEINETTYNFVGNDNSIQISYKINAQYSLLDVVSEL